AFHDALTLRGPERERRGPSLSSWASAAPIPRELGKVTTMSKFRKLRKSQHWMRGVGALGLLSLLAGCERTQADSADLETPNDVVPARADVELVLHLNTIAAEI